jgi:hypothetical protein
VEWVVLAVDDAAILTSGTSDHAARNGRRDAELGSDKSRLLRRLNSIVKPGISPGFGLTGANFIRGSIATARHLPRSRTHLLRVVNLAISATNTDPSWGVVVMLFSLRVHTCLPTTRARRVFRPAALADGEPFLPTKSVDAIDA